MKLSILDYLHRLISKALTPRMHTSMRYPTPISLTLGMNIKEIGLGTATIEIATSIELRYNTRWFNERISGCCNGHCPFHSYIRRGIIYKHRT